MTYDEFKKLRFRFSQHLSMDECHICVYESEDPRISMTIATECTYADGIPDGKERRRYNINGKQVANNKKSITKAIKDL